MKELCSQLNSVVNKIALKLPVQASYQDAKLMNEYLDNINKFKMFMNRVVEKYKEEEVCLK